MIRQYAGTYTTLLVLLAGIGLGGCVDEEIVYRDRPMFEDPPESAASFIGYSKEESKLTVCGNCHAGMQAKWQETAHASAWSSLQESGHAAEYCNDCHTVGQLGNPDTVAGGYATTKDARYQDVQCESCHGAGLPHLTDPEAVQPFATMKVSAEVGCGECHQGEHNPFVEEWAASGHGVMKEAQDSHVGDNASCQGCHTGEGALKSWGFDTRNVNEQDDVGEAGKHLAITCAVCHDPHSKQHEGQLRFAADDPTEEGNLCMKCHHKRGEPDVTTFRGPHSPEGPMLMGYGGWRPPNLDVQLVATHGSEKNPRLCAGCHVNKFQATDSAGVTKYSTGHSFEAIPCVSASGAPTGEADCALESRSFKTCTAGGCHGSEGAARSAMITGELRLEELAGEVKRLLDLVQPNWEACRQNNSCGTGSPFNTKDGVYTTAEGAAFNWELGASERLRPGSAVHNPFLSEALLTATIKQLRLDYPAAAGVRTTVNLNNVLSEK